MHLKFSTGVAGGLEALPGMIKAPEEEKEWRAQERYIPIKPPRWTLDDIFRTNTRDTKVALR